MRVVLKMTRLSFPELWEPKQFNGTGEPACGGAFLMDPKTPEGAAGIKLVKAAIEQVASEKWKDKAPSVLKALQAKEALCLRDGSGKAEYEGYDGMMYVSARNKTRPHVLAQDKTPLTEASGKPYSGCYVNVSLDIWAQENQFGKRVNAKLLAVQFAKDGEAFSGGESYSEDDFEMLDSDDDGGGVSGMF